MSRLQRHKPDIPASIELEGHGPRDVRRSRGILRGNTPSLTFQMVTSESLFEYYVALTLRNGSTVDYPSGRSGFLPVASSKSMSEKMRTEQVSIRNPRLDYVEEDPSGNGIKIRKRRMYRGPWDYQKSPSCVRTCLPQCYSLHYRTTAIWPSSMSRSICLTTQPSFLVR